ncbi:putative xylanase, Glycoside hydrolase family 10, partial [Rhizoctonia solani]
MVQSHYTIVACALLAISPALVTAQSGLRGLHRLAKAKGRYFGTATDQLWTNTDSAYLALTGNSSEFGVNTPGNQQKWDATEKTRNVQLPSWVSSGGFDNATLISIMQNHISKVAGHFKGQLYAWDVVNEAFEENGSYRNSVFYNTIGPAFIPIALRAARAADPTAKLYLNDYNTDWRGSKSDAYYNLAKSLLAQGVPLDGIGFQGHLIVNSFERTVQENFKRFADLGLEIAITELDIRMTLPATEKLLQDQAENYAYIVKSCLAISKCVGITTWDTSDDYSWIPSVNPGQGAALLFDGNKKPKPAYYSVADALAAATVSMLFKLYSIQLHTFFPIIPQLMVFSNKKLALSVLAAVAVQTVQGVAVWGQCGGSNWTGGTTCDAGSYCKDQNDYYSQCVPGTASTTAGATGTTSIASTTTTSSAATATATGLRGLHALAKAKGRYFGTATDQLWNNNDAAYLAITGNVNEFGANTPGNQQKWDATEKTRNVFTYTNGDYQVAWAKNHSQIVRGHTLGMFSATVGKLMYLPAVWTTVWHSQLASWVSSGGFDNATLVSIVQNHIANVAGHYKGQVYAWDVVNEMFNEDGTWRTSVFYNTIGPSYVAIALRAARAADPTAKLYLNDYNIEWTGAKSDAMYNLAKDLLAQGVPLDGIGFQGHLIVNSFYRTFQANFERFAALGLDVALTELDIRYALPATDALITAQAENYKYVTNACLAVSRCVGITVWDTSDDYSWVPSTFPGQGEALLFDKNKQPKPAYYSVADALAAATVKGTWD